MQRYGSELKLESPGWKDILMLNIACDSLNIAPIVIIERQLSISPTLMAFQSMLHLHRHQTCVESDDLSSYGKTADNISESHNQKITKRKLLIVHWHYVCVPLYVYHRWSQWNRYCLDIRIAMYVMKTFFLNISWIIAKWSVLKPVRVIHSSG